MVRKKMLKKKTLKTIKHGFIMIHV